MRRGTTPTITIHTDVDLTAYSNVVLTIQDYTGHKFDIAKADMDVYPDRLCVTLTQRQTLDCRCGVINLQIRAVDSAGKAIASNVMASAMDKILKEDEIYAD